MTPLWPAGRPAMRPVAIRKKPNKKPLVVSQSNVFRIPSSESRIPNSELLKSYITPKSQNLPRSTPPSSHPKPKTQILPMYDLHIRKIITRSFATILIPNSESQIPNFRFPSPTTRIPNPKFALPPNVSQIPNPPTTQIPNPRFLSMFELRF